jgi:hypothetical protein
MYERVVRRSVPRSSSQHVTAAPSPLPSGVSLPHRLADIAVGESVIQRVERYTADELQRAQPLWTTTTVAGYEVPKRMIVEGLNAHNLVEGKEQNEPTALYTKIAKRKGTGNLYINGHMLNHNLGGPDAHPNLVPINSDANTQMSVMENVVLRHVTPLEGKSGVVDYEVVAHYGRSDGAFTAENAIPTSLDMRYIPQYRTNNGTFRDDEQPIVQNVQVNLKTGGSTETQKKKITQISKQASIMHNFVGYDDTPKATKEGEEIGADDAEPLRRKNELARRLSTTKFVDTDAWKFRQRYLNQQDIVSGELAEPRLRELGEEVTRGNEEVYPSRPSIQSLLEAQNPVKMLEMHYDIAVEPLFEDGGEFANYLLLWSMHGNGWQRKWKDDWEPMSVDQAIRFAGELLDEVESLVEERNEKQREEISMNIGYEDYNDENMQEMIEID